ncbi:Ribosomal RNA-processing protein 14 [Escovopsis weberi]|uniref:Ribosomal RNA-processing protein 14 n=1 Tax=Escovopsis weberi TaxID=150374 RepID=A0A0M8MW64_ESCWE|nr:Ribosomal RNA-processing protein 14 [Escovopsis weberi]
MGDSSLQDRLRDHAKAFNGLLSLIPAKMYYGEDRSDQWSKEKQTKQEAAAARRAKLDPDSALHRNAKEVMDERAEKKRRLRQAEPKEDAEAAEEEVYEPVDGVEAERPLEGLKIKAPGTPGKKLMVHRKKEDANKEGAKAEADEEEEEEEEEEEGNQAQGEKKQDKEGEAKGEEEEDDEDNTTEGLKLSRKEGKRAAKREKKAEKRAEKKAEKKAKSAAGETTPGTPAAKNDPKAKKEDAVTPTPKKQKKASKAAKSDGADAKTNAPANATEASEDVQMEDPTEQTIASRDVNPALNVSAPSKEEEESAASAPESGPQSPTFDTTSGDANAQSTEAASITTSVSSAVDPSEKPKQIKIPADTTALRARLAAKIEALRAARKADGPDGKPIRTRQELIEARRAKEAQRKEHKKELRRLAREEESKKREEALASNSPGVMSPVVGLDQATGSFSFGRVAFADGSQMSHDLSYFLSRDKKKGPSDPKTALLKVQNQKKRLEELDEAKRKDATEKEAWLTARRRAEGDKIRDDENMLKKAVKRKETAKKKSEKAWKERATGVAQAQRERQRKREDNIKQRREDKLLRRSGKKPKKGGAAAGGKKKKGGRPGFEGSLGVGGRK